MAKRLTGTNKWDKAWFRKLSPRHKALWQFLCDRCDQAGIWEIDFDSASHYINDSTPITMADIKVFGSRVEKYDAEKLWIVDFVDFQCGELSPKCPAHKPVFKLLTKYNLLNRVLNRVSNREQEIEIEIEIEEEKEVEKEKEKPRVKIDSRETRDFTRPDVDGDELHFPIYSNEMRGLWAKWKQYRWEEHGQKYGMMGEQADLKRFEGKNFHQIQSAILEAIANKWKNLYPDKGQNGKANGAGTNKKQQHIDSIKQSVTSYYEGVFAKNSGQSDGPGPNG